MDIIISPANHLEQQLKEAGEHLSSPPSSINSLLHLLDKTKQLLSVVGQGPSKSMQGALVPSMAALIGDQLIKHSDIHVRISVASCLCEVSRITAPDIPYNDEIMKEIFRLNVFVFGQLSDTTSFSYVKVIHVLESVAKVKSCLLMLDLECDSIILDMFEKLLDNITKDHPHTVFSDIETIMTLIIRESDEVHSKLIYNLISHVKMENKKKFPASWKIAEKVLRNCYDTLKPYHETITELIDSNVDEYAAVVTLLCKNVPEIRSTRTNSSMKKQKINNKNQFKATEVETPKRGRPKRNNNRNNTPNLAQNSHKDTGRTRSQDKRQSNSTEGIMKNSGSLYNASRGKDIPKKRGQDLVGHRIKVWWPLDEMFYKGVVSSYDPLDGKHKVVYVDGDEEVLDLSSEKWRMLDEIPSDQVTQQEKVTDLPSPFTTPAKPQNQTGIRKLVSLQTQEDNPTSPKRPSPAYPSKTTDVINKTDNVKDNLVSTPGISCGLKVTEYTIGDVEKDGESYLSGDLQEKSLLEPNETTQRLEKSDSLVCET